MTEIQERRAEGAGRVRVETLVEVCGNEPGIPAFEAEAVDVSARGMHLRTAYLPDNGAPLVCRFEDGGKEIVVEGRVAWRRESSRGGEFGVQFTALDSGSVGALRDMCDASGSAEHEPHANQAHDAGKSEVGSRVRLHIDGLGSPMKARVRESGSQNVKVGSNLEFLKVGRKLEVEDLEAGGRRQAQIDGVSVAIDPQTHVPQLVVQLRFADDHREDTTPEPSVLHFGDPSPKGFKIPASAVTTDGPVAAHDTDQEDDDADAEAFRGKLGEAAANAGEAVHTAGAAVARFSARAAQGMGGLFKGAAGKVLEMSKRGEAPPPRRTTAPAPNGSKSVAGPRLRPQSSAAPAEEPVETNQSKQLPRKKLVLGAGAAVLLASVVAAAALHHSPPTAPPGAQASVTPAVTTVAPPSTGAPLSATPAPTDLAPQSAASANVPLFGPTPMATMEPAPLAPPPGSPQSVEAQEKADAKNNPSGAPMAAGAADEGFSDESSDGDSDKSDDKASKAEKKSAKTDTTPWGKGKLHSPTIYRLRLDGPGGKLQGATLSTGFTVLIPNHKVMEQGASIAKRDTRISSVHTSNRTEGAEVSFRFRESIPAYRVRLRRDYVEILIGQGETKEAKGERDKGDAKVAGHAKAHKG